MQSGSSMSLHLPLRRCSMPHHNRRHLKPPPAYFQVPTIALAIARRSSSERTRRSPLIGVLGSAKPISKARCSSTVQPATRFSAGSLISTGPFPDLFSVRSYLPHLRPSSWQPLSPLPIFSSSQPDVPPPPSPAWQ